VRKAWRLCVKAFSRREPVAAVVDRSITADDGRTVRLRCYTPKELPHDAPQPALVWIHGGGFVFGDLYTGGAMARALANRARCVVVAVEYRLAPEHSLHDGLADCRLAFRWIVDNAASFGLDPGRVAIGGDSAGATLAALVSSACRNSRQPAAQLLAYPATDLAKSRRPLNLPRRWDVVLTHEHIDWLNDQMARCTDLADPSLSPLHAGTADGVAPTILLTAGFDPLCEEGLAYADKLDASGVPVMLLHYPGQFHGFLSFDGVLGHAREALDRLGVALAGAFATGHVEAGVVSAPTAGRHHGALLWLRPAQRWQESMVVCEMLCLGVGWLGRRLLRQRT